MEDSGIDAGGQVRTGPLVTEQHPHSHASQNQAKLVRRDTIFRRYTFYVVKTHRLVYYTS